MSIEKFKVTSDRIGSGTSNWPDGSGCIVIDEPYVDDNQEARNKMFEWFDAKLSGGQAMISHSRLHRDDYEGF